VAEAVQTLEKLLADDPHCAAADKALYEWAWAEKARGNQAQAAVVFARLAAEHPQSPMAGESLYYAAEEAYRQADYRTAADRFAAARDKLKTTSLGEKAAYRLGLCRVRLEEWPAAQAAFHQQRETWPKGPFAVEAALREAESWFRQDQHAKALPLYELVMADKSLKKESFLTALLHSGEAQERLGKFDAAMRLFEQALREGGATAAEAQFRIGQTQAARKAYAEALQSFVKVAYGYSYPRWQAEATYEAGRCQESLGKPQEAAKLYRELLEKFPKSELAPRAQARLKELPAK
jgi:cellulose synthase operon protein C